MIDGLAFVPIGHLNIAVQVLRNNVPNPVMQPLLDYFVNTYVIGQAGPPPQPPMFPPQMWNKYQITLDGDDRTNVCEGWKRKFNIACGNIRHPPFYKVIKEIQKYYTDTKLKIVKSQNGTPLAQRVSHGTRAYNRNVTMLCRQYQNNVFQRNMLGYLHRISGNIRFK